MNRIDKRASDKTRARCQRIVPIYDLMETLPEQRFKHWRKRLRSLVDGSRVLEVGVGTGIPSFFF
jgi:ubiquinone/menaquinone biosynthesis C-methylase UbiE